MYAEFPFCNHIGNAADNTIDLPEPASDKKLVMSELEVSDIHCFSLGKREYIVEA